MRNDFLLLSRCWCLEVSKLERKEAKVFYVDYGNCEWISWDRFTDIHKRFWELAPQAVPFKLAGNQVYSVGFIFKWRLLREQYYIQSTKF